MIFLVPVVLRGKLLCWHRRFPTKTAKKRTANWPYPLAPITWIINNIYILIWRWRCLWSPSLLWIFTIFSTTCFFNFNYIPPPPSRFYVNFHLITSTASERHRGTQTTDQSDTSDVKLFRNLHTEDIWLRKQISVSKILFYWKYHSERTVFFIILWIQNESFHLFGRRNKWIYWLHGCLYHFNEKRPWWNVALAF